MALPLTIKRNLGNLLDNNAGTYYGLKIEGVLPPKYNGEFVTLLKIAEVRGELLNTLRKFGTSVKRWMLIPTTSWDVKPVVKTGIYGQLTRAGNKAKVMFSRSGDVAVGAYIEATENHTPWSGSWKTDTETRNDAAWHYIWANNGVEPHTITPKDPEDKLLRYRPGYNPSTSPKSWRQSSRKRSYGEFIEKLSRTTGVVRRDFVDEIAEDITPFFEDECMRAVVRGLTRPKYRVKKTVLD